MALHFERKEYAARIRKTIAAMEKQGLDGILLFQQESMYYLTGYDTFGFCFFQCLYLGTDGTLALLTRVPDLRQAQKTSIIKDIRVWTDQAGAKPADQLKDMLKSLGAKGKRLGFESNSYGLTHANGVAVTSTLKGFCKLVDASDLVNEIRLIKSPAELDYVRKAGKLGDAALKAAIAETHAGADEGRILAAMQGAIFAGGGDYPANEFIIGSADEALCVRYKSGRRKLGRNDQMMIEYAGVYRHYHAAFMRTLIVGKASKRHRAMYNACREALFAAEEVLRPGHTAGEQFDAHARVMDAHGMRAHRLNASGYGLGAKFTPSWMDFPMLHHGNAVEIRPNMVFFSNMVLLDSETETAMALGRTYITTEGAPESVSRISVNLIER